MALSSMTGFARVASEAARRAPEWPGWVWEVRSVNHRGLDMRVRLPSGMDRLEPEVRKRLQAAFARGSVQVTLSLGRAKVQRQLNVNWEMLDQVLSLQERLGDKVADEKPTLAGLLAIRGVIDDEAGGEDGEVVDDALATAMLEDFSKTVETLAASRAAEGARLEKVIAGHLDEIGRLTGEAAAAAAAQGSAIHARLLAQIAELRADGADMPEDRLAQEVALLVAKADVREEIDRLAGHVEAGRALLDEGGAIGRRLDFLCQEFNREANTVCSKSSDMALTRVGLALKTSIDQLREQVQNLE